MEGLQILKPNAQLHNSQVISPLEGNNKSSENTGGVNVELQLVISEDMDNLKWVAEHLKFSVRQPVRIILLRVITFPILILRFSFFSFSLIYFSFIYYY